MDIRFRELNPFNCWIWMRFGAPLGPAERGYVETLLDSWFFLGKLGGFNAENLQCHEEGVELGWMGYDLEAAERALPALMHNMGVMEYREDWARCWLDLGTSDAFSLDVLINSLGQLNRDVVEVEELLIGGENDDWPVEQHPDSPFALADDSDGDQDPDGDFQGDPDEDLQGFGGNSRPDPGGPRSDSGRGPGGGGSATRGSSISGFDGRVP